MSNEVKKYSQLYERSPDLRRDSERMRKRLLRVFRAYVEHSDFSDKLARHVERECGIDLIEIGSWGSFPNWDDLFNKGELRDLFDTITMAINHLPDTRYENRITIRNRRKSLRDEFSRVFAEECVGYWIEETGTVRRCFDDAMEAERKHLLMFLDEARFVAAIEHMSTLDAALLDDPIDGRRAIRAIFDVLENLFKLAFPGSTQLNKATIEKKLRSRIDQLFAEDAHAARATQKLCASLIDWVEAAHNYRHEPGKAEHEQPPVSFVLAMVGTGYSFARWLAEFTID